MLPAYSAKGNAGEENEINPSCVNIMIDQS